MVSLKINAKFRQVLLAILLLANQAAHLVAQISYATMVKVPKELHQPIAKIQQYIQERLNVINEEIKTANKFLPPEEQVKELTTPEKLDPTRLHMTLQMIADGRKIIITDEQLPQLQQILQNIANDTTVFDIAQYAGDIQFVLMGNFLAMEFLPAPQELENLSKQIQNKLTDAGIKFGPVYPTFKAHISFLKTKDALTKVAIRSLADGWSGTVKDIYPTLAPANISTFPINNFFLTTMDEKKNIVPVTTFELKEMITPALPVIPEKEAGPLSEKPIAIDQYSISIKNNSLKSRWRSDLPICIALIFDDGTYKEICLSRPILEQGKLIRSGKEEYKTNKCLKKVIAWAMNNPSIKKDFSIMNGCKNYSIQVTAEKKGINPKTEVINTLYVTEY